MQKHLFLYLLIVLGIFSQGVLGEDRVLSFDCSNEICKVLENRKNVLAENIEKNVVLNSVEKVLNEKNLLFKFNSLEKSEVDFLLPLRAAFDLVHIAFIQIPNYLKRKIVLLPFKAGAEELVISSHGEGISNLDIDKIKELFKK